MGEILFSPSLGESFELHKNDHQADETIQNVNYDIMLNANNV